jgi:hypothetical protein
VAGVKALSPPPRRRKVLAFKTTRAVSKPTDGDGPRPSGKFPITSGGTLCAHEPVDAPASPLEARLVRAAVGEERAGSIAQALGPSDVVAHGGAGGRSARGPGSS